MAKYVIEIPYEVKWIQYIQQTGHGTVNLKVESVSDLTPYTEPDRKAIEDAQEEAWEFARLIVLKADDGGLKHSEFNSCFGGDSIQEVMKNYSYQEAKAKYEAWMADKKQKETSELEEVTALANRIGIHRLYSLVKEIRGE